VDVEERPADVISLCFELVGGLPNPPIHRRPGDVDDRLVVGLIVRERLDDVGGL
jgi:hypothetical protein